ncbi:MAG: ABC transporter permease [Candidatus Limnocylindrales bacterium]
MSGQPSMAAHSPAAGPRVARAAAPWRAWAALTMVELRLTARRGENLLVTLAIPLGLLIFLAGVPLLPPPTAAGVSRVDALVPGILALAVISTGLVSLGIATAFEREGGVLKRLGGAPLPRWALVAAKAASVAVTVLLQVALIAVVGWALGWHPQGGVVGGVVAAAAWLFLGIVAFAGLGLLLAGRLRPEVVLALANGLYLVCLLVGGVIVPLDRLPAIVAVPASLLPPALLADLLRGTLVNGGTLAPLEELGLAAWAVGAMVVAALTFRVADEA